MGKTYKLMLEALQAASEGKDIIIVAHRATYAREIVWRVQAAAKELGADMNRIRISYVGKDYLDRLPRGNPDTVILKDNSCWEAT